MYDPNSLFLTKLLCLFVYPLGAVLVLGSAALILSFTAWRRIGQLFLGLALAILYITATPIFAAWLGIRLEAKVPLKNVEALPQSDVVIVLGGARASRILDAWRVYRAGKAPVIVTSGGHLPWETAITEAERMASNLMGLGVPQSALVLETRSRTTRENALMVAAIFKEHGWRNGLLVTSGYHMPRALASFRKVGLTVVPATTDINRGPLICESLLDLLPSASALEWTTSTVKEMIGMWMYRLRGWA